METTATAKERPILFSGAMVRAILEGRKTQTRRVLETKWLRIETMHNHDRYQEFRTEDGNTYECGSGPISSEYPAAICPYGQPGDRLWVRETFRLPKLLDKNSPGKVEELCLDAGYRKPWVPVQYEADGATQDFDTFRDFGGEWGKARPSIHLPRWLSRLTLDLVSVRVERLQAITYDDAIAEGIERVGPNSYTDGSALWITPQRAYQALWDSINAKREGGRFAWAANPWVWVIGFRRVDEPPR